MACWCTQPTYGGSKDTTARDTEVSASVYQSSGNQNTPSSHSGDNIPYYAQTAYSPTGASSGYSAAETSEMMATTQMPRHPYPPMQYHAPQSNSPAQVPSPAQHDHHQQHRGIYGQPPAQPLQQTMYYQPQHPSPYQSMGGQHAPPAYPPHGAVGHQTHQTHQTMTTQPNMMMPQAAPHNPMAQHQHQHQHQHQSHHTQQPMSNSPRLKMESKSSVQSKKPSQQQALPQPHSNQNGSGPLSTPTSSTSGNNAAAPGPIPATTPLVVRQDKNGVQWIAFEYSRDRVKMEYTIRCDVESVQTDQLSAEFKTENCVYPRACCPKEEYRGNRQVYETDCNTVGWALADLNPPLRGKRGLIQRAVDSWRNSNQDPRLRSRRVRRMAKVNTRKNAAASQSPHLAGHAGPTGMHGPPPHLGPATTMVKPNINSINNISPAMHHHPGHPQDQGHPTGEEVGPGYGEHHHHAPPAGEDVRPAQVFTGYNTSPSYGGALGPAPALAAARTTSGADSDEVADLFPDMPEAKKRKFILVEDNARGSRLRIRVTLEGVNTKEIPDSFRKGSSVFPRSFFPREMQSPPPSATGSSFFEDDVASDDGNEETEGRELSRGRGRTRARGRGRATAMVKVPVGENKEGEVTVPRMRRSMRGKEVKLNELGYRMAWLQSRVFSGRTLFLQRAMDSYRNKTRSAIESMMQDVKNVAPHYETRVGKRRWNERMRSLERKDRD
ncbi:uncharacterized protein DNG_02676 [Cephalotrichum gorgonifer]|uniref:DUF8032 domain-containing protein n=1 Tax=Cephalotrichum gorgonifer TaxID=2041049 RepID=A0AAE8MSV9_9PEZI|nr:uncharacterized protein DNG_02676 [Cephalotrichum gorgonifer]